ncbi:uncharacterized protein LOC134827868 isoform X2 [Culicoides brevitarsis]|uniref:uncharacterized protein LOC134827868 isoform X1 n=1 Tax=Culicoides brevitarsis TaxID=469753 RepID=UPI00307C831F
MENLKKFISTLAITFVILIAFNVIGSSTNAAAVMQKPLPPLEHNQFHQLSSLETNSNFRLKRALVFRPLFVYKEQEVRRQKLKEERAQRRQQQAAAMQPQQQPHYG